jgi:hypothetical protein
MFCSRQYTRSESDPSLVNRRIIVWGVAKTKCRCWRAWYRLPNPEPILIAVIPAAQLLLQDCAISKRRKRAR